MKRLIIWFVSMLIVSVVTAEELASASRWDVSLSPYKYGLQGEIVRTLDEYRTSVNQSGLSPNHDRQMRAETERLTLLLKSRGYYLSSIETLWPEEQSKPKFQIELGPEFTIASIKVSGDVELSDDKWQKLKIGDALNATDVIAQQAKIKTYIEQQACYFKIGVTHQVELDEANRTGNVEFISNVSQPSTFGVVSFVGTGAVKQSFLRRATGIKNGECYKSSAIDSAVISLFDTGLFSQVRSALVPSGNGTIDVVFTAQRKKDRRLKSAIGWESERGLIGSVGWLHRDLMGSAQSLELDLTLQADIQEVSANVIVPSFYDRRNRLNWKNTVVRDISDIETWQFSSIATLERKASLHNYYEYGFGYNQEIERVDEDWSSYRQIRLPLTYRYDSVLDPFNPGTGFRTAFQVEPVWDIDESFTPFILTGVGLQSFVRLEPRLTFANRIRLDSLWYGGALSSTQENIPESEWLKAGGSTSIRGYGYESIELPQKYVDSDTTEDEAAALSGATQRWLVINELRLRLNDSWGFVAFWDMGSVDDSINPLDHANWYSGMGAGVRYFTRFAPIRLDVAFPQDRRAQDDAFIIYVSLGQAF